MILTVPRLGCAQDAAAAALRRWHEVQKTQVHEEPDPLLGWMDQIAQRQLQARAQRVQAVHTLSEARQQQQWVRRRVLEIMGGLPSYRGPLNARTLGRLQAGGYTIDKVYYESLPGFYVTANLYRPARPGRYPAVLVQAGHTQEGKPEDQRLAANLALKGFVVLAFDPIGQGEREQTYDPQIGGSAAGWGTMEHLQAAAQALLLGEGVARYFIWDAIRSTDYLASLPDVDADRIGAAGCSGGGALTTFLGALDPRIKAVASACSTNTYQSMFGRPFSNGEFHAEMSLPELLAAGLDTADFVELAAPKPWIILATEHDFFTPAAAKPVYEEARRWYALWGAEDKLRYFVGPGPHGMPLPTREIVYDWMTRWLKDGRGDTHEQPVRLFSNLELLVTPTGHVQDLPGSRKLYQIMQDEYRRNRQPQGLPELTAELGKLGIPAEGPAPAVTVVDESENAGLRRQQIRFESEPGVEVEGKLLIPSSPSPKKPALLLLAGNSSAALAAKFVERGNIALIIEPRDSPWGNDYRPLVGNWVANTQADLIGRNLPAMRAHDIAQAVNVLAARSDVDAQSIRSAASGVEGIWVLLAAAANPHLRKIWLDRTPRSFRSALDGPVTIDLVEAAVPDFVLHWDVADLVKLIGNNRVMWTDPANWIGKVVPLSGPFQYRYVLGDVTDMATAQDDAYVEELLR